MFVLAFKVESVLGFEIDLSVVAAFTVLCGSFPGDGCDGYGDGEWVHDRLLALSFRPPKTKIHEMGGD